MWEPREFAGRWWVESTTTRWTTGPYASREDAQNACDSTNAFLALEARKDAALDWALAGGASNVEIDAALRMPGHVGLLDFEARMADAPHVVVEAPGNG